MTPKQLFAASVRRFTILPFARSRLTSKSTIKIAKLANREVELEVVEVDAEMVNRLPRTVNTATRRLIPTHPKETPRCTPPADSTTVQTS